MKWIGKALGGGLGLLAGGPLGAALGVLVGHQIDEQGASAAARKASMDTGISAAEIGARFFRATFQVMGHVAKADGRVSEREIAAARSVMDDFRLDAEQIAAAIACFNTGKQSDFDMTLAVMALRRTCANRPDLLHVFLEIQLRVAIVATDLRGPERGILTRMATMLGVGGMEFAHLESVLRLRYGSARRGAGGAGAGSGRNASSANDIAQAYEVLEVASSASDVEISKAYRRQLSRHHPDKLKSNGLPESMMEHAKQRTQQIIEAWDLIRERRGIK